MSFVDDEREASRAATWTGRHAKDVGLWGDTKFAWTDVLDEEIPTVGTMLREQGYYTAFEGTWHLSHPARSSEALEGHGFSDYDVGLPANSSHDLDGPPFGVRSYRQDIHRLSCCWASARQDAAGSPVTTLSQAPVGA